VRLPFHRSSEYAEIGLDGVKRTFARWDLIQTSLLHPILNSYDLEKAIKKYNLRYANEWKFTALHEFFKNLPADETQLFFKTILPQLINLALRLPELIQSPLPLLKKGTNHSISMSQEQAASLLANAFFCTFPRRNTSKRDAEYSSYPDINFQRLYQSNMPKVIQKLMCIYNYFKTVLHEMPTGVITFQRRSIHRDQIPEWRNSALNFSTIKYHVSSNGTIEGAHSMLQVDFANCYVGGGVLGSGSVQEEIRFVINSEMIVARLFTESLDQGEALVMIGCEQYSTYKGYASTFSYNGDFKDQTPVDSFRRKKSLVVAIDALHYKNVHEQFTEDKILRELRKAFAGFYNDGSTSGSIPIATGLWGCGAFNGHPLRSALIQFMACRLCRRNIAFFTFGDGYLAKQITDAFNLLVEKDISVGRLLKFLVDFRDNGNPNDTDQLLRFIRKECDKTNTLKASGSASGSGQKQSTLFQFMSFDKPTKKATLPPTPSPKEPKLESRSRTEREVREARLVHFKSPSTSSSPSPSSIPQKSLIESLDEDMKRTPSTMVFKPGMSYVIYDE